ncbi:hypothetical protein [Pseudonocardia adelaidensis]|uniref:Uncharacterized protein n=1 Tax=Pseudonocardia adelaidensis TaxID=648754 RepID=A0ABP9NVC8_9PSEU
MKRRIVAMVLLMFGMLAAGGTAVAFADQPGMTHNSVCEKAECMTHN